MNLLCPNCQKMLTVPEQYAGQLMKCPLCSGTFTVPNVPAGPIESAPAFSSPPAPSTPPPAPSGPYGLQSEPEPAFPTAPAQEAPAFAFGPPEPAFSSAPPPTSFQTERPAPGPASSPATLPSGYTRSFTLAINDKVLQFVPPAALVLIFFLHFFPWVGVYPGGVPAVTQSAWGAAFGAYSEDKDMRGERYPSFRIIPPSEARERDETSNQPGISVLLLFYLVPLFLITLVVTVGVVVLSFVPIALPPQVQQILPWRWAIVAGLNAVLLLFLGLQLLLGFSLENNVREWFKTTSAMKKEARDTKEEKLKEATRGTMLDAIKRTVWMRMAVFLHLFATIAAALVYWVEKRGAGAPLPMVELRW